MAELPSLDLPIEWSARELDEDAVIVTERHCQQSSRVVRLRRVGSKHSCTESVGERSSCKFGCHDGVSNPMRSCE